MSTRTCIHTLVPTCSSHPHPRHLTIQHAHAPNCCACCCCACCAAVHAAGVTQMWLLVAPLCNNLHLLQQLANNLLQATPQNRYNQPSSLLLLLLLLWVLLWVQTHQRVPRHCFRAQSRAHTPQTLLQHPRQYSSKVAATKPLLLQGMVLTAYTRLVQGVSFCCANSPLCTSLKTRNA